MNKFPRAFLFFAISLSLWLIFWTSMYVAVTKYSWDAGYVGLVTVTVSFLTSVLGIAGIISGLRYKSETRGLRLYNRAGIIGSVLIFLFVLVIFLFGILASVSE